MIKKHAFVFVLFLGSFLSLSAQKNTWTLGLYSALKGEVVQAVEKKQESQIKNSLPRFHLEANLIYGINNRLFLCTGIGYGEYSARLKYPNLALNLYQSIQIPLFFTYDIPLDHTRRFSFFPKLGLKFDFIFNKNYASYGDYFLENNITKNFNVLINTGLGFKYEFPFGLNISLIGEYNTGTRIMGEMLEYNYLGVKTNQFIIKGDYWGIGIGVSYTFKNKKINQI